MPTPDNSTPLHIPNLEGLPLPSNISPMPQFHTVPRISSGRPLPSSDKPKV